MKMRLAKISDVGQIYQLGKFDFKKENWYTKKIIKKLITFNPKICWILEDKGKVIGARMFLESFGTGVWGWLILIKKEYRHQHLGTTFFERTCKELKRMGYKRILTDVETGNNVSIKWHKKVGYVKIGYAKDWFDRGVDAVIFKKEL